MTAPLDVSLAAMGYLRSPDGRLRHVPGLEALGRAALRLGVAFRWGAVPADRAACSFIWRQEVVVAPHVFDGPGWLIRDLWAHELAHCMVGTCCGRARRFQQWRFGHLLCPPEEWAGA